MFVNTNQLNDGSVPRVRLLERGRARGESTDHRKLTGRLADAGEPMGAVSRSILRDPSFSSFDAASS